MESSALLSPCGLYRYRLERRWDIHGTPGVCFVMLNPSTANGTTDDATIRRCISYARAWGFGHLSVANLFAYRSTDPYALFNVRDPVGPDNDRHILTLVRGAARVVVAWGAHGKYLDRGRAVLSMLRTAGAAPVMFGRTSSGEPLHPLRLRRDAELVAA